jgi:hypothetical protein
LLVERTVEVNVPFPLDGIRVVVHGVLKLAVPTWSGMVTVARGGVTRLKGAALSTVER